MIVEFKTITGETFIEIMQCDKGIFFFTLDYEYFLHIGEGVEVTMDVCGDIDDLLNFPILKAEEKIIDNNDFTASFYTIANKKAYIDIKFQGDSGMGWYCERAFLRKHKYSRKERDEDLYMFG